MPFSAGAGAIDTGNFRSYAKNMQIDLTPEQHSLVHLGIEEGRFRKPEDAVRNALALWEKRERSRVELIASLDMAAKSLDAGEGTTYTSEIIHELVEEVERRGMAMLAGTK
jgi:Arc/MetJ-type ribon-helix-helix transcriptional regulator